MYSADGNSDPKRDGMIGIIRQQKQAEASTLWGW